MTCDSLMWIVLCLLSSLPSIALSNAKLEPECKAVQLKFASAASDFTTCLGKNTKPVRICVHCSKEFESVNESFFNITDNRDCSAELLDSDNAMVIRRLWDSYRNMWTSALCSTCSGLSLNRTTEFGNKTEDVTECFDTYKKNKTRVCVECAGKYNALRDLFKELQGHGFACADLADSMNSTSRSWSVKYGCGHPKVEYLPVLAMTFGISFVPVIFYTVLWKYVT